MHLAALTIELYLPGCSSLKAKRGRLKPLLAGLHRHFNVSAAEIDRSNNHQRAVVACAVVSNDVRHAQRVLEHILPWLEKRWPNLQIVDHELTVL